MISFMSRCLQWAVECFDTDIVFNKQERNCRFLEESLELVQSLGLPKDKAIKLVDYVYSRLVGESLQETGGVQLTLNILCAINRIDLESCGKAELKRAWSIIDKVRAKQLTKDIKG